MRWDLPGKSVREFSLWTTVRLRRAESRKTFSEIRRILVFAIFSPKSFDGFKPHNNAPRFFAQQKKKNIYASNCFYRSKRLPPVFFYRRQALWLFSPVRRMPVLAKKSRRESAFSDYHVNTFFQKHFPDILVQSISSPPIAGAAVYAAFLQSGGVCIS